MIRWENRKFSLTHAGEYFYSHYKTVLDEVEEILKVDLYETAVLLEEVGKVIKAGGVGVTISSQFGHRMPTLTPKADEQLAVTPTEEVLGLSILQPENIKDTLHAYQMAKRCNGKRVMAEAVKWGQKGTRINSISPGIVVTTLAIDEFNGPRGDFYKHIIGDVYDDEEINSSFARYNNSF